MRHCAVTARGLSAITVATRWGEVPLYEFAVRGGDGAVANTQRGPEFGDLGVFGILAKRTHASSADVAVSESDGHDDGQQHEGGGHGRDPLQFSWGAMMLETVQEADLERAFGEFEGGPEDCQAEGGDDGEPDASRSAGRAPTATAASAREGLNIRAALEFSLTDSPATALEIAGTVHPFGIVRGRLTETRRWLDRSLAATSPNPTMDRIRALYSATMTAALQSDLSAATARAAEGRALVEQKADPETHAVINIADGFTALVSGEFDRASARFEDPLGAIDEPSLRVAAMVLLGCGLEFRGEMGRALIWQETVLALAESRGESVFREYALRIGHWV